MNIKQGGPGPGPGAATDMDFYRNTKIIFEHVYDQYKSRLPVENLPTAMDPAPAPKDDFLASIAQYSQPLPATPVVVVRSELERYFSGESSADAMVDNPLAWWKVCSTVHLFYTILQITN